MRIGIVTPQSGFAGGLERYAWMVGKGLKARGHHVEHLYEERGGRDESSFAEAFSAPSRSLSLENTADLDILFAQRIDDLDQLAPFGDKPLVIASHDHAHTCVRTYRYLPLNSKPCHRAPGLACVTHGCVLNKKKQPGGRLGVELRNPFSLRAKLQILASRAQFVACSHYIANNLISAGVSPSKVQVGHPIPVNEPVPLVTRPEQHLLVFVAQLVRGKGGALAISALTHLPAHVRLRIVGDGPSRASLEELAGKIAPGRVEFTGYVAPESTISHYDAARVVLVPSMWPEPYGMVGIEAMRRARPVVAANHGGIPEWAPNNGGGALFEPGSARDLARAAQKMLNSNDAGERAYSYTHEQHDHEKLLTLLEKLFAEQLANVHPRL